MKKNILLCLATIVLSNTALAAYTKADFPIGFSGEAVDMPTIKFIIDNQLPSAVNTELKIQDYFNINNSSFEATPQISPLSCSNVINSGVKDATLCQEVNAYSHPGSIIAYPPVMHAPTGLYPDNPYKYVFKNFVFEGSIHIEDAANTPQLIALIVFQLNFKHSLIYGDYLQWDALNINSYDPHVKIDMGDGTKGYCYMNKLEDCSKTVTIRLTSV